MVTTLSPLITLNNGIKIPLLGLGVYDMHSKQAESAIEGALSIGYRLVDTAAMYGNEVETGRAIRKSGIPREEIFVTTKVANGDQGYESTLRAFDTSAKKLDIGYIDLYLVHWPVPGKRRDTWRALEKIYGEKRVRAIGVANYTIPFLEEMQQYAQLKPALTQVEFTPYLFSSDLLRYCLDSGIQLQSYSPLVRGRRHNDPRLLAIAKKYNRTPAQILLRWAIEHGVATIPKSANPERLSENFAVFDFSLSAADVAAMDGFHENLRVAPDPSSML